MMRRYVMYIGAIHNIHTYMHTGITYVSDITNINDNVY